MSRKEVIAEANVYTNNSEAQFREYMDAAWDCINEMLEHGGGPKSRNGKDAVFYYRKMVSIFNKMSYDPDDFEYQIDEVYNALPE